MDVTFSIKQKSGADWELIKIESLAGKTLEQSLCGFAGKEVVAEFIIDGKPCYFCGTAHWLGRMSGKGKAVSFDRAIDILRERNPQLLQAIIPGLPEALRVFPGSEIESIEITDPSGIAQPEGQRDLF